jgi:hypothetical protein
MPGISRVKLLPKSSLDVFCAYEHACSVTYNDSLLWVLYVRWRIDASYLGPGEAASRLFCGQVFAAAYMEIYTATVHFAA